MAVDMKAGRLVSAAPRRGGGVGDGIDWVYGLSPKSFSFRVGFGRCIAQTQKRRNAVFRVAFRVRLV